MKTILQTTIFCLLVSLQALAQKSETTIRIGAHFQPNYVAINGNFLHYKAPIHSGLFLEIDKGKRWTSTYILNHYIGKIESKNSELFFGSSNNNGSNSGSSTLITTTKEQGVNLSVIFNRKITIKKLQPFIGIGFDVQLPLVAKTKQHIQHPNGEKEHLEAYQFRHSKVNSGILLQIGNRYDLTDRLSAIVAFGSKSNYIFRVNKKNLSKKTELPLHQSFFGQVGIAYRLGGNTKSL